MIIEKNKIVHILFEHQHKPWSKHTHKLKLYLLHLKFFLNIHLKCYFDRRLFSFFFQENARISGRSRLLIIGGIFVSWGMIFWLGARSKIAFQRDIYSRNIEI